MNKIFAILGAGMQGTAAAYDLALFAEPARILLADMSFDQAQRSAARVNQLVGREICEPFKMDALNADELYAFLSPVDVVLSCVPYWMHPHIASVAIKSGTHMCDLGGSTDITERVLAFDELAKSAGVTLIPDTGLAPGLVNSIGLYLLDTLEQTDTVRLYCGVLPQHPRPPFNYKLTFNIEGLVAEYDQQALVIRDGAVALVDTLSELEEIEVDGLGTMEAFTTSGGTSTAPYTLLGRVTNYEYKTIRFPGHCEKMRIFKDFGFWSSEPVEVDGNSLVPRHVFYKVFGHALKQYADLDQCIVRGVATGTKNGHPVRLQVDIHDRQCSETGFTSMERLTGFSISIHAIALANGELPPGCIRYESGIPGENFLEAIQRRGIQLKFSEERHEIPALAPALS